MISFSCDCGKKLQVKDEFAGREGTCPNCGRTMLIPGRSVDEAPPANYRVQEQTRPDDFDAGSPAEQRVPSAPVRRTRYDGEWVPHEDLCNHGGSQLSDKDDFFAPPPDEIGEIVSANTSLRLDTEPMSPAARMTIAVLGGGVGTAIGVVIALALENVFFQVFWPVLLGGLGLTIALVATRFSHTCTYVGRQGVARYGCAGRRDNLTSTEVFLFQDAAELRSSQTRHYTNGVYQHTAYSYSWTDVAGRTRFSISGNHKNEAGTPPSKDPYHFATAAEMAWTMYLLNQVQAQLQMQGSIYFGLGGKNWVRLGEEKMTLHMNGETTECHAEEIGQVLIEQGIFRVKRKDAKEGWFSSSGVFKFNYGNLANAQLFLILLDKLVGVKIN